MMAIEGNNKEREKENSNDKIPVKSVTDFIQQVFDKKNKLNPLHTNDIWYRGEGSEDYKPVPNLFRSGYNNTGYCSEITRPERFYQIEQNIDTSFYRKASVFLANKGIENTPWNRYFLKQHYGIKTRLLDWTENALYALFFAVQNDKETSNKNAKVYLLSPFKLNNYSTSRISDLMNNFKGIFTISDL